MNCIYVYRSLIGQKQHKALSKGLGEKGFTFERTEKEEQSLELYLNDQLSTLSAVRVTTRYAWYKTTYSAKLFRMQG